MALGHKGRKIYVRDIAAATDQPIFLRSDGSIISGGCCGRADEALSVHRDYVAVAAGDYHVVGLRKNGQVVAAFITRFPEAGAYEDERYTPYRSDHGQCWVSGWENVTAIAAGGDHTLGLCSDGTVLAAGDDCNGQCSGTKSWKNVIAIAAGAVVSLGLRTDGRVLCTDRMSAPEGILPWENVRSVTAGRFAVGAVLEDGTAVVHGLLGKEEECAAHLRSGVRQLAIGMVDAVLSEDGKLDSPYFREDEERAYADTWENVTKIVCGDFFVAALHSDGTVSTVGNGRGSAADRRDNRRVRQRMSTLLRDGLTMQRKMWMQTVKWMLARRDDPYGYCSDGELDTLRHIPSDIPPAEWETSSTWDDGTWPTYDLLSKFEKESESVKPISDRISFQPLPASLDDIDWDSLDDIDLDDIDSEAFDDVAQDDDI